MAVYKPSQANSFIYCTYLSVFTLLQARLVPLTLHSVLLRFQSAHSPPAAHNLACLAACISFMPVIVFVRQAPTLYPVLCLSKDKNIRQALAFHCSCLPPSALSASTVAGARSRIRSFLPPAPLLSARRAPALRCGQVCHSDYSSFGRGRYYLFPKHNK